MSKPDTCVIYNPTAGRGRANQRLESLRQMLGPRAEFRPTERAGHAEDLALEAAKQGFAIVAAAGGDGTVHEVANGLMRARIPDSAMAIYPVGSANDYAYTLGLGPNWWTLPAATRTLRAVDIGVVRAEGKERYFINGLGLGFNGMVTLESRRIRWLQGVPLYLLALVQAMRRHFTHPVLQIKIDETTEQIPTLALTVALGRREGNFLLAPNALVDDGLFDYLHAGQLGRWRLIRYVPAMISGNLPTDDPAIRTGRCRSVRIEAETPLVIHTDGEFFCRPEDGVRQVEIEMLPGALRVQQLEQ